MAIADGTRAGWSFLDAWHAIQHLKAAADAAFGEGSPEAMAWFEKWHHILRHEPQGAFKVIDALCATSSDGVGALTRSWQPWRPPARGEAANDNRALALAA